MLASLKSMEASRATLAYVVFGCILAILCSLVLIQAEADRAASTINCAAFRIYPMAGIQSPPELSKEQALVKLHFHRQQMTRQGITDDRIGKTFFQRNWEPSLSCTVLARLGCPGDGGKWVCDPYRYLATPCVLYSFGSNDEFSFEEAVHNFNPLCEIHTFDPVVSHPNNRPSYVNFHPWGVGVDNSVGDSVFTLPTIMRKLGHTNVSIVKIDCEGCELDVFDTPSFPAISGAVQQILMEVHFDGKPERVHRLFNFLVDMGYAIVNKEANIQYAQGKAVEYSLVHLKEFFHASEHGNHADDNPCLIPASPECWASRSV